MARKRQTVRIEDVIQQANGLLRASDDHMVKERLGICALLERILFDADRYAGFNYLPSEKNSDGTLKEGHDDSRRIYYYR